MLLPLLVAAAIQGVLSARWLRAASTPQMKLNSSDQRLNEAHFVPMVKYTYKGVEELLNLGNAQYLATIVVGGQHLKVVPDTGSFSLLLTSTRCHDQECPKRSFDRTKSSSYKQLEREDVVSYGSGRVWTHQGSDEVSIAALDAKRVKFWEITRVGDKMETLWKAVKFDGIMGLGWRPHAHSTLETTVLETFDMKFFTFCFGTINMQVGALRETSSRIYWGEEGAKTLGEQSWKDLDVIAVNHWAVKIKDVGVQGILEDEPFHIGCGKDQPCAAILDTGTSVISPPIRQLRYILNRIGPIESDCGNYAYLPTLHFWLGGDEKEGGFPVELTPDVYIRKMSFKKLKGRIRKFKKKLKENRAGFVKDRDGEEGEPEEEEEKDEMVHHCAHRFLFSLMDSQHGPVWLLGAPFFQKYLARFDRSTEHARIGLVKHPGACPGTKEYEELDASKDVDGSFFVHRHGNTTSTEIPWNLQEPLDVPGVGFAVGADASITNITITNITL